MSANDKSCQNQIMIITVGNQVNVGSQAVGQALAEHFRSFSRKGNRNQWKCCGQGARVVTQEKREILVRPFLEKEVRAAIKGLNGERSPSPDDIPVFFYGDFWDLVGPNVMAMFEDLHHENMVMERINKSHIFLLPKRQGADRFEDFCPISLSNSIYLIIAKVQANRM